MSRRQWEMANTHPQAVATKLTVLPDGFLPFLLPIDEGHWGDARGVSREVGEVGQPVAKIQLTPQMKPKLGRLPLVYGLFFPEGDVTDARPL
jgi:hypothetical protein